MNYIYLIREREFIRMKENVYKIGRTNQEAKKRISCYPKSSECIIVMKCNNSKKIENIIKKKYRYEFNQRKDIGNEYFEGDVNKMIEIL